MQCSLRLRLLTVCVLVDGHKLWELKTVRVVWVKRERWQGNCLKPELFRDRWWGYIISSPMRNLCHCHLSYSFIVKISENGLAELVGVDLKLRKLVIINPHNHRCHGAMLFLQSPSCIEKCRDSYRHDDNDGIRYITTAIINREINLSYYPIVLFLSGGPFAIF